jgi:hypothetical protein
LGISAACVTGGRPPGIDVEARWRDAMRRRSSWAILPPGEDAMVGGVVLHFRRDALAQARGAPAGRHEAAPAGGVARGG